MGYLVLENGESFQGRLIGSKREAVGEVVFTTGMSGYEETLADPSHKGQIVVMTYPLIGNYGINFEDMASERPQLEALVVRELCDMPSNWRSQGTLESYLTAHGITGIQGIDTRALTKTIRDCGSMRGMICAEAPAAERLAELRSFVPADCAGAPRRDRYEVEGAGGKVAVLDFGLRRCLINSLRARGLSLTVLPPDTPAAEILDGGYDGAVLSNGCGWLDKPDIIENIKLLCGRLPVLGIDLGHLLLAKAHGLNIAKLKYGHRGNQPIKDMSTGKMYITPQNHAYAADGLPAQGDSAAFVNWNDGSVEGVRYGDGSLGVQFFPETDTGPNDAAFIYDDFVSLVNGSAGGKGA